MQQKNVVLATIIIIGLIIIVIGVFVVIIRSNEENANNIVSLNNSTLGIKDSNINLSAITPSKKRVDAPAMTQYEVKSSGERCAIIDLNNYIPLRDEVKKVYEWIIEFPPDDCVIQKSATNIAGTLGELKTETIIGTNYRRIIVSYE